MSTIRRLTDVSEEIDATPKRNDARLIILTGPTRGRRYYVRDSITVGRGDEAQVLIDNPHVSRVHARIHRVDEKRYEIEDLNSQNGTAVNGEPIDGRHTLSFGDRIQVGSESVILFAHYDRLEDELARHQRVEAMGQLTAGIAHNFNSLLGTIVSTLDYLDTARPDLRVGDEQTRACLWDIRGATMRATELVTQLLAFAPAGDADHKPTNVSEIVRATACMLQRTFGHSIEVHAHHSGRDLASRGSPARIQQALMALCMNARDAMPDGGELTLRIRTSHREELSRTPLAAGTGFLVVEVEDTGTGMDAETLERAFHPFFTTRPDQKRSGLGLAIAFDVAESLAGHLDGTSTVGKGSRFRLFLPLDGGGTPARSTRPMRRSGATEASPGTGPTVVLLVDDEDMVRRSTGRLLRQNGYEVLTARDGIEAVDVYQKEARRPDIVLLDLEMPRANGVDTYRALRRLDPCARILFVSGYWESSLEQQMRGEGAMGFLRKPFPRQALESLIERALGGENED